VASPVESVDFNWGGPTARLLVPLLPARVVAAARDQLGRCPAYWPAWEALGLALARLGREEDARAIFTGLDPYLGRSPIPLGKVLFLGRRDLPGMPAPQRFPEPENDRSRLAAALIDLRAGRVGAASGHLDTIDEPSPESLFFGAYTDIFRAPIRRREARARLDLLRTRWPANPRSRHLDLVLRMLEE
jgi:hypothetical protein